MRGPVSSGFALAGDIYVERRMLPEWDPVGKYRYVNHSRSDLAPKIWLLRKCCKTLQTMNRSRISVCLFLSSSIPRLTVAPACVDCGAPRPQWASISFGILICLQCAGTHRGFGVHIRYTCSSVSLKAILHPFSASFVRSISMDTWQEDQLRRMKVHTLQFGRAASAHTASLSSEETPPSWPSCVITPQSTVATRKT